MRASGFPTFQITVAALSSERSLGKMPGFKQDLQIWTHGWFLMYFKQALGICLKSYRLPSTEIGCV